MMLRRFSYLAVFVLALQATSAAQAAGQIKPFVLASVTEEDFDARVAETKLRLEHGGFTILGEYSPYNQTFVERAHVIVVTSDLLQGVAQMSKYGGFAAPLRVAVTRNRGLNQVAYANPEYLMYAYRLKADLRPVTEALTKVLGFRETFGSKKGLTAKALSDYRYAMGMEKFTDVYDLAEYRTHDEAVAAVEQNLAQGTAGLSKVYRLDLANGSTVFGVGRKAPTNEERYMDDAFIMNVVDHQERKGTAYLPYEILVDGNKVVALHMRFRMAVHYPDLGMVGANSFMKIMSSPAAIEKALKQVAGG
jgi:hypothetical protein